MNDPNHQTSVYSPGNLPPTRPEQSHAAGNTANYGALPNTVYGPKGASVGTHDVYQALQQDHSSNWHSSPVGVDTYARDVWAQRGALNPSGARGPANPGDMRGGPSTQVTTRLGMDQPAVYNPLAPRSPMSQLQTPDLSGLGMSRGTWNDIYQPADDMRNPQFAQQMLQTI